MGRTIRILAGKVQADAELNDTKTAQAIWGELPIEGRAARWGEELYFSIPVELGLEAGQELVSVGDLGYWPDGHAFCIFFGPTPVSGKGEIRAASPVTVFGRVMGDATVFRKVAAGTKITIVKAG